MKRRCTLVLIVFAVTASGLLAQQQRQQRPGAQRRRQQNAASRPAALPPNVRVLRDLEYSKPDGHPQLLDLYLPKEKPREPMPLVVWIHGGGWRGGDKDRCPSLWLLEHGYAVASINYRLTRIATWPAQIHDCKAAIRWLRAHAKEYGYEQEKIGVWGGSAGGHLVAMLGTSGGEKSLEGSGGNPTFSSKVQAVCDWYGPSDLVRLIDDHVERGTRNIGGNRDEADNAVTDLLGGPVSKKADVARSANPITYISKEDPPFLIMHGDKDPLVYVNQSELLHEALRKAGVPSRLEVFPGAVHGGPQFASPESRKMILAFFDAALKNSRAASRPAAK